MIARRFLVISFFFSFAWSVLRCIFLLCSSILRFTSFIFSVFVRSTIVWTTTKNVKKELITYSYLHVTPGNCYSLPRLQSAPSTCCTCQNEWTKRYLIIRIDDSLADIALIQPFPLIVVFHEVMLTVLFRAPLANYHLLRVMHLLKTLWATMGETINWWWCDRLQLVWTLLGVLPCFRFVSRAGPSSSYLLSAWDSMTGQ